MNDVMDSLSRNMKQDRMVLLLAVLASLATVGWLLVRSTSSIDLTDESYYVLSMRDPFLYPTSVTQFGFVLHPLYQWLGGDVALLRQATILITFGLSWAFMHQLLRHAVGQKWNGTWQAIALVCAASGLAYFTARLPTPCYNSLTLHGLLLAATSMVLANRTVSKRSVMGWGLLAIGGVLVFLAKPSSAFALAMILMIYLPATGRWRTWLLPLSGVLGGVLLMGAAWLIDGSLSAFAARLQGGMAETNLQGGYSFAQLLRIDRFSLTHERLHAFITIALITAVVTRWQRFAWVAMLMLLAAALAVMAEWLQPPLVFERSIGLLLLAAPLGAAVGLPWRRMQASREWVVLSLCLLALPHVYAFGTNGNYWHAGAGASIFWLAAIMVWVARAGRNPLPLAVVALCAVVALLSVAMQMPYRQTVPVRAMADEVTFPPHSRVRVSEPMAAYLTALKALATEHGFAAQTPVIDLTGRNPGSLYYLDAKPIGKAWMIGGYTGSAPMAVNALKQTSCELIAQAWLLREPAGPRPLPDTVLEPFGLQWDRDYQLLGFMDAVTETAGKTLKQSLHRPIDAAGAKKRCQLIRGADHD